MNNNIKNIIDTYINVICQNRTYVIKSGDTLSKIAKRYNTTVKILKQLNNIQDQNKIIEGKKIIIPTNKMKQKKTISKRIYVVKSGDTLSRIAQKYKVNVDDIVALNNIENKDAISIGMRLQIPSINNKIKPNKSKSNKRNSNSQKMRNQKMFDPNKNRSACQASSDKQQIEFVARIIYSETSSVATQQEIKLVCAVIRNRIGQRDFNRGGKTAYDTVKFRKAFSCVKDPNNSNWNAFDPNSEDPRMQQAMKYATELMTNPNTQIFGKNNLVYYHDHSLSEAPKGWYNQYWTPKLEQTTQHFKFYSVFQTK